MICFGLCLEEAGHFRVGMQLGLGCLTGSFWQDLVLVGPEMGECCTDGPEMGLL